MQRLGALLHTPGAWLAFAALVLLLDYFSGPAINLTAFFFIPVVLAAWHRGVKWAVPLATALPAFRFLFEWSWESQWTVANAAGNAFMRLVVLAGFGMAIAQLAESKRKTQRSEMLLQSLIDNIPQGIIRKDMSGRFTFANQRFCDSLGKTPGEVVGRTDTDLFPPDLASKYGQEDQLVVQTGRRFETVEERRPFDNSPRFIQVIKTPLREPTGKFVGVQGIYWDITEQHQSQELARQTKKMEAVGILAHGVAHHFNNLLAVMLITVDVMLSRDRQDVEDRSMLRGIKTAIERATCLTRELVAFAHPGAMQTKLTDLNQVAGKSSQELNQLLGQSIEIQFLPSKHPLWIRADEGLIQQVMHNLAINARDAMPGGGMLTISIGHRIFSEDDVKGKTDAAPGEFAVLELADAGHGMDKATLDRIFEPFFTTKPVGKGTGLGLAMVHGIVKRHQGWVEVESRRGHGSSFRVHLPLEAGAAWNDSPRQFSKSSGGRPIA